jgi:hypothetical protein
MISVMLLASLERLGSEPKDMFQLAADTVRLLSHFPRFVASGYFATGADGQLRIAGTSWSGFAFERDEFHKGVFAICQKVSHAGVRENFSLADARNMLTWCVPLRSSDEASDVLAVKLTTGPEPMTMTDHQPIENLIGSLKVWHANRQALRRDAELRGLAAIVELVTMIEQSSTLNEAAHHVVNELQKFLNCQRVALRVASPLTGGSRLETISGAATFDAFSDTAKYFQAACDETAMRGTIASAPPLNPNAEHSIIALKNLLEHQNAATAVAVPLMLKRSLIGTLILRGSREALLKKMRIEIASNRRTDARGSIVADSTNRRPLDHSHGAATHVVPLVDASRGGRICGSDCDRVVSTSLISHFRRRNAGTGDTPHCERAIRRDS